MNVSEFLHKPVKVETSEGTVEGTLKHVDYYLSSHSKSLRAGCLILENWDSNFGNRLQFHLIIVKNWKVVKKA